MHPRPAILLSTARFRCTLLCPALYHASITLQVFDRIMQMTDNAGATDEHRALNYLTVRYPALYAAVADAHARNLSLRGNDRSRFCPFKI